MSRTRRPASPALPLFEKTEAAPRDVVIHTDGACSGNPGPGGWAAIVERGALFEELGGREEHTTNNRMEMTAAVEGLRRVQAGESAHVVTDSRYLVDGITKWVHGWKRRGWRKADGAEVLNREIWEELDGLVRALGRRVTWEHVRGHAGHERNERCDALATAFARGESPELRAGTEPRAKATPSAPALAGNHELPAFPSYLSFVDGVLFAHRSWVECEARVHGAKGARHRKVRSAAEYEAALAAWGLAHG